MSCHIYPRRAAQRVWAIGCIAALINGRILLSAQEAVDSAELENNLRPVEFIDNTETPSRIDTREQIFNIGSGLGEAARNGAAIAGSGERYYVIHRLHPAEFDKLDGDIFVLGEAAEVDRIANLRLIIQGYLEGAYGYSSADAALLSNYITIYNAVYRLNRAYFSGRYKTPLMSDLAEGREGLSVRWDEWPGGTMMLIPLQTALGGSLSAVDTTSITSDEVIDEMRKDDDRGVEERRQMVDLKEREAEEAAQRAAIQREEIAREEESIAAQRRDAETERQRIAEERAALEKTGETAAETGEAGETGQENTAASVSAREREGDLDRREEAVAAAMSDADEREKALEEKRRQAEANEEFAERKIEEADAERSAISEDQREMIAASNIPAQNAAARGGGVLGVRLSGSDSPAGTPVLVDPLSGQTLKTSTLNSARARALVRVGGKIVAIAGENGTGSVHRLVEIDAATLQTVRQGPDEINSESLIWVNGASLYAIVNGGGGRRYLARFNTELEMEARSESAVHPFAAVFFEGGRLITENAEGDVLALDPQSLN
jgi:hypothetical protein